MPTPDFTDQYNTQLSPAETASYQAWLKNLPPDMDRSGRDYDLQGAFKAGESPAKNGHLPDTFKKPNHPTFSDESEYSGKDGYGGGHWTQNGDQWSFTASNTNLKMQSAQDLQTYFSTREKGSALILPHNPGPKEGPGLATTHSIAPGQAQYQKLLSGGYSAEEANQWRVDQTQKLVGGGFTPQDIDDYWGDKQPNTAPLDAMNRGNAGIHQATDPLETLEAGWQMSVAGLASRGKVPDVVAPEHAGLLSRMLEATGQFVGDLPATVAGFIGGAGVGTSAGAAVGSAVPVVGTAAGGVVGGVGGAGFGANAVPQAMREMMLDYYNRGEIHTTGEFAAMAAKSTWNTAKAGITGLVAAPVGGAVGSKVLTVTAKPFLATGANMASQAVTATTVAAGLEGHMPNADDFIVASATMLGFHAAGKIVGAAGGQRVIPTEAARRVSQNLQTLYRQTGVPPWEAVKKAQTDPNFRAEVLAQDIHGEPVTPNFKASAPDEPPLPDHVVPINTPKKLNLDKLPSISTGQIADTEETTAAREAASDRAGDSGANDEGGWSFGQLAGQDTNSPAFKTFEAVSNLLPRVQALEASWDESVSPAGAIGRYQIMPGTARQYGLDPAKLMDPAYNEMAARKILTDLHRRFRGDEEAILTAYNAGPGRAAKLLTAGPGTRLEATDGKHGWTYERVDANRSEAGLPMETQEYLARNRASGGGEGGQKPPGGNGGGEPPKQIEGPEGEQDPSKLDTETRVAKFLDKVGKPPEPPSPFEASTMYRQFVSELGPAREIDKLLASEGLLDRDREVGIEDMMRQTYGSGQRAGYFLREGTLDPITMTKKSDVSFLDVMHQIKAMGGNVDEFNTYRTSLRTIEKAKQGIDTGVMTLEEAKANAADPNLKRYAPVNKAMQAWKDDGLEYGRDSGLFSQKQVDAMKSANTSHISLRRVMDNSMGGNVSRRGFRPRDPLKRMEGSDRQIIDPTMADMDNMAQIVRMADRNRAIGSIIGAIEKRGMLDRLGLTRLAAPKTPEITEGADKIFAPYGETGKGFEPFLAMREKQGESTFTYFRNGKKEIWEAKDPVLASLLRGADSKEEASAIDSVFTAMANLERKGIVSTPDFPLRNTLRDQIVMYIADKNSPPPFVTWLRGAMHVWNTDDVYWDWVAKGGAGTALADLDGNYVQREIGRLMDETTGTYNKMWNVVRHPIEAATLVAERLDAVTRVGYKMAAEERGIDSFKAATLSRKAALDFAEKGTNQFLAMWSRWTPFLRPNILGLKQFGEALTEKPMATLGKSVLAVTLPSVMLYGLNYMQDKYGGLPEDQKYSNLPRWERDTMYIIPSVGGVRLRMPMPPVIGPMFGGLVTRFLDHYAEHDPAAFENWLGTFFGQFLPPLIPTAVMPISEAIANHSWFSGRPLIPDSLKDASGDMQYTDSTTEPAKALARLLGPHQANLADVSPIVLDNFAREWTGTLGVAVLRTLGTPMHGGPPWQVGDIPFIQSFIVRNPGLGAQPIQDFYDQMQKLEQAHANTFLALRNNDMKVMQQDMGKSQYYARLLRLKDAVTIQRSVLQSVYENDKMTKDEKRQVIDRVYSDMIGMAKMGSQLARSAGP